MRMLLLALALAVLVSPAQADEVTVGDITLHYSALPTTNLTPEVARQYGITRSASRGLLNLALLRRADDGSSQAVTARISAAATNENGQRQDLRLREVREGEAIYYLAEVRVADRETMTFDVSADVDGQPVQARFRQQFFAR